MRAFHRSARILSPAVAQGYCLASCCARIHTLWQPQHPLLLLLLLLLTLLLTLLMTLLLTLLMTLLLTLLPQALPDDVCQLGLQELLLSCCPLRTLPAAFPGPLLAHSLLCLEIVGCTQLQARRCCCCCCWSCCALAAAAGGAAMDTLLDITILYLQLQRLPPAPFPLCLSSFPSTAAALTHRVMRYTHALPPKCLPHALFFSFFSLHSVTNACRRCTLLQMLLTLHSPTSHSSPGAA
jgi:hypothetical protein